MCRLFGMSAGAEAVQATFWLLDAPDSLVVQSRRDADGTGVGYFGEDGEPHVDKQPIAAFEDRRFASEARSIRSRTYVAHVRHATTGGLTVANTHPFCQRGRLFAHNGVVEELPTLERHLGADRALVAGDSDSERYFALITREIDRHGGNVRDGIAAAVDWIVRTLPIVSINFVLVTATDMWALRYPETDTLYVLERPAGGRGGGGGALEQTSSHGTRVRSEHARDHALVVVASERMDDDAGWREVRSGELLHVGPSLRLASELLLDGPPRTGDAD
ncbi:MAG TPA: class II glutamine amidotransferase [Solirubrobacteraceae bacterium]|jgi:glutamine amidotransferase|nr:class II glutamine amidotransferase [Solirubrobacteraceae bacterium]